MREYVNVNAMKSQKSRPTIKDIANIAGVSIGTVDRALHNRQGIGIHTKSKILTIAREIGYQKNKAASGLSRKKPLVFAAVFPEKLHYFYDDVRRGFKEEVENLKDFKLVSSIHSVCSLGHGEERVLQKLLREDIDGLVLVPGHKSKLNHLIDQFAERGVPVVTVSTDAPRGKRLTSVCVDPRKNGELAGELLANFVSGSKVAIMVGSLEIEDHFQKVVGFREAFSSLCPEGDVVAVLENQESEILAAENTKQLLAMYPDLSGIYVATANSVAVCRVLVEKGVSQKVKVVTTDLFDEIVSYLQKGVIRATLFQNPYRQGRKAVELLFRFLVEKYRPKSHYYLEPIVVMRSNLSFYYSSEMGGFKE